MANLGFFAGLAAGIYIGSNRDKLEKEFGPLAKMLGKDFTALAVAGVRKTVEMQENFSDFFAEQASEHVSPPAASKKKAAKAKRVTGAAKTMKTAKTRVKRKVKKTHSSK